MQADSGLRALGWPVCGLGLFAAPG